MNRVTFKCAFTVLQQKRLGRRDTALDTAFADSHHLPEDGLSRPSFAPLLTYAPGSPYARQTLIAARLEPDVQRATIYCHAASTSALRDAEDALNAALWQWSYLVTVEIDGETWTAYGEPTTAVFEDWDSGMVAAHTSRAVLTIPVNPDE